MQSSHPERVLVMPEYGVDLPLWDRGPGGPGTSPDELGLSDQLAARLRAWNAEWQNHPPEKPRPWSAKEQHQWRETGYRLARQLQAELTDVEVLILDDRGREVPISTLF